MDMESVFAYLNMNEYCNYITSLAMQTRFCDNTAAKTCYA